MSDFKVPDIIGTPFKYGGRPDDGSNTLDCYGLVQMVLNYNGIDLPERPYSKEKSIISLQMSMQMNEWELTERQPGAVLLFRVKTILMHVGVVIDEFRFMHTWDKSGGVCVERIADWEKRIAGVYRYVG